jgi:hypothetical protein
MTIKNFVNENKAKLIETKKITSKKSLQEGLFNTGIDEFNLQKIANCLDKDDLICTDRFLPIRAKYPVLSDKRRAEWNLIMA